VVLDGAGGTELHRRGVDISGALWSAEALRSDRSKVVGLHADYAWAGAEVHTAVTFRTHPGLFVDAGGERAWRETLRASVEAVEEGIQQAGVDRDSVWVAGSLAPVGDCYTPGDVPEASVLEAEHQKQAQGLLEAGVDLVLVETMLMLREAKVAARAAKETGLPVLLSFVVGGEGRLLSGEPLQEAVALAEKEGVDAVLVNCASIENTDAAVEIFMDSPMPWGVYANGSRGQPESGWGETVDLQVYLRSVSDWLDRGARVMGSCCATGSGHTKGIRRLVDEGSRRMTTRPEGV
jgi:homocysteine S-methyltransferase